MDFIGKTNEEIIKELLELINRGEKITVQDLVDAVSTRSVVDTFASSNAVTLFYGGETEEFINALVKQAGDDVRIIRRTEAYDFFARREFNGILTYAVQQDNPGMLEWM